MKREITIKFLLVFSLGASAMSVAAQTPKRAPVPAPTPVPARKPVVPPKPVVTPRPTRVVVQNEVEAPQVVTILHRLNGLKVFRLLMLADKMGALAGLDEDFKIADQVHTNVIAGLALDDGRTIAAWLPEVRAEMPTFAWPRTPVPPGVKGAKPKQGTSAKEAPSVKEAPRSGEAAHEIEIPTPAAMPGIPAVPLPQSLLAPADLKVITRDGKRVLGHYIGLDALTGLSVIRLSNGSFPKTEDLDENAINVGQRIRLIGPEPAPPTDTPARNTTYVRIGEREGIVVHVKRSPSGHVSRVKVKSSRLSPVNIGSIAINSDGETLGIVDAVVGSEATIVPMAVVRNAARRVVERQSNVPRAWLGIRGEPLSEISLERIRKQGWELGRARALLESQRGIMLTQVVPESPAARANLKPGDVILNVNDDVIRNSDDFTWVLQEAGPGESLQFKVARPGNLFEQELEVELGESPDPWYGWEMLKSGSYVYAPPASLKAQGIEAIPIREKVAMRLGATTGMLVVHVEPETAAFKAGLRPGDVIEDIEGEAVTSVSAPVSVLTKPGTECTVNVVRNRKKVSLTIQTAKNK